MIDNYYHQSEKLNNKLLLVITQNLKEFYSALEENKPILAIDYGQKKWGVAISNPALTVSMPIKVLSQDSFEVKLQDLLEIIRKYKIIAIIIGLPININGTSGTQSELVINFAKKIEETTGLPIFLQDERLTSKAADKILKFMGMKRIERNQNDDAVAASMILETVLQSITNFKE